MSWDGFEGIFPESEREAEEGDATMVCGERPCGERRLKVKRSIDC